MLTRSETRAHLRCDWERIQSFRVLRGQPCPRMRWTNPSWLSVWCYRWARYHHLLGRGLRGRLWAQLGLWLSGADLPAGVDIGPGLVLTAPIAISLCGRAGRNLTVHALSGLGGEMGTTDVGAGPGMPWLGDDVTLEPHSGVLGAVRIGDRVRIRSGAIVTEDVPADSVVEPSPPRVIGGSKAGAP